VTAGSDGRPVSLPCMMSLSNESMLIEAPFFTASSSGLTLTYSSCTLPGGVRLSTCAELPSVSGHRQVSFTEMFCEVMSYCFRC
jgi:hypothetical protein